MLFGAILISRYVWVASLHNPSQSKSTCYVCFLSLKKTKKTKKQKNNNNKKQSRPAASVLRVGFSSDQEPSARWQRVLITRFVWWSDELSFFSLYIYFFRVISSPATSGVSSGGGGTRILCIRDKKRKKKPRDRITGMCVSTSLSAYVLLSSLFGLFFSEFLKLEFWTTSIATQI